MNESDERDRQDSRERDVITDQLGLLLGRRTHGEGALLTAPVLPLSNVDRSCEIPKVKTLFTA